MEEDKQFENEKEIYDNILQTIDDTKDMLKSIIEEYEYAYKNADEDSEEKKNFENKLKSSKDQLNKLEENKKRIEEIANSLN